MAAGPHCTARTIVILPHRKRRDRRCSSKAQQRGLQAYVLSVARSYGPDLQPSIAGAKMVEVLAATDLVLISKMLNPRTTAVALVYAAETHTPPRRTWLALAHERPLLGPNPVPLEQRASHAQHALDGRWILYPPLRESQRRSVATVDQR